MHGTAPHCGAGRFSAISLTLLACGVVPTAQAAFIEDSKAKLSLRNFYMNRDFRHDSATQSYAEEWAQGFLLDVESGYTEGTVGFGLDVHGLLGVRLDSGAGRSGAGVMPYNPVSREPVDDYSHLGLTAKARISETTLHVGNMQPALPLVFRNFTRLLPTTFDGSMLRSTDIDNLEIIAAKLTQVRQRDSSGNQDLYLSGRPASSAGEDFDLAGLDYRWTPHLRTSLHYGRLDEVYEQRYLGLQYVLPLDESRSLGLEIRHFDSSGAGAERAGEIDNRNLGGRLSFTQGGHKLSLAYQQQSGDTGTPFLAGTDPYTLTLSTYQVFLRPEERSWQVRYDLNFAAYGIPGLTLMARRTAGSGAERGAGLADDREWERDIDLGYVVQSGALAGFGVLLRNVAFRSRYATDVDENRVLLTYSLNLW